jgi:hypothetical protein
MSDDRVKQITPSGIVFMGDPLESLTRDMGRVLKEAYESGYSTGSRDTREEIIAQVRNRIDNAERLDRDNTELVILLAILKSDRL